MSAFSRGQLNQLGNSLEAAGWLPEDLANFGQAGVPRLTEIRDSLRRPVFDGFFHTREGLWVSEDFRRLVVAQAKTRSTLPKLRSTDLDRKMTDAEIEHMLGEGHTFTEAQACAVIEKMITEQEGGKSGRLLNNGFANIFYTSSCVVDVCWGADERGWSVYTWLRGDNGWRASNRAFSSAT